MIINHNIAALNTHRQMGSAQSAQMDSMEKLSSGMRINKAADDVAGLTISEKMRGQIRGLEQASNNAQDGISLIQTAEGALSETQDILQRMRELSVQGANDTNTAEDRKNIQSEVDQLGKEIDRIAETTQFNSRNLLDGSMDKTTGAVANVNGNTALKGAANAAVATTTDLVNLSDKNGNSLGIQATDTIEVSYVKNGTTVTNTMTAGALTVAELGTSDGTNADANIGVTANAGELLVTAATAGSTDAVHGLTITVKDSSGNIRSGATNALSSFSEKTQATDVNSDGSATFQIGANSGQSINLGIKEMGSSALGVKDIKVGNQGQANVAIKVIDEAIRKVSTERSNLGATQNRLEHTINNLNTSAENLTSAESRIRDVDYAEAA